MYSSNNDVNIHTVASYVHGKVLEGLNIGDQLENKIMAKELHV